MATLQDKLNHFGPRWDPGRLAFPQPFANLRRTFRGFLAYDFFLYIFLFNSCLMRRRAGVSVPILKPIRIWEKLPKLLFNGCMNATITAKHEYYIAHTSSLRGVFRPFANLSPPFRHCSKNKHPYLQMSLG